jgi:hypothetical protein
LLNSIQNVCLSVVPAPHLFIGIELLLLSLQEIIVFAAATASVSNLQHDISAEADLEILLVLDVAFHMTDVIFFCRNGLFVHCVEFVTE